MVEKSISRETKKVGVESKSQTVDFLYLAHRDSCEEERHSESWRELAVKQASRGNTEGQAALRWV